MIVLIIVRWERVGLTGKKGAWKEIKQWPAGEGCKTPDTCPYLNNLKQGTRQ